MRKLLFLFFLGFWSLTSNAQRPELSTNEAVHDSVMADLLRQFADGLWENAIAAGDLKGEITLDFTIDDKGRVETVMAVVSTLSVEWKNLVQSYWLDHRFHFKLPKSHKEKVSIDLKFPLSGPLELREKGRDETAHTLIGHHRMGQGSPPGGPCAF
jgi:hypothetical protein